MTDLPRFSRLGTEAVRSERPGPLQRPIEALDLHLSMIDWLNNPALYSLRHKWWLTFGGDSQRKLRDIASPRQMQEMTVRNSDKEREHARMALTQWVAPDLSDLTQQLGESMEPRPLRDVDLWAPYGFVVLPKGVDYYGPDYYQEGVVLPVRVLSWGPTLVGLPEGAEAPAGAPVQLHLGGTRSVPGIGIYVYTGLADVLASGWIDDSAESRQFVGPLPLIDYIPWAFSFPWSRSVDPSPTGRTTDENGHPMLPRGAASIRMFLLAYWQLLDEQVIQLDREYDRPASRRAQRLGRLKGDGDVVHIARLRRLYDAEGQEMDAQRLAERFTHRWWVRGHHRHYDRGEGLLEGQTVLLDHAYRWPPEGVVLRLTDPITGMQERVRATAIDNDLAQLEWAPTRIQQGLVEVERLAWVKEHTAGAENGPLVERYDVISVER